MNSNFKLHRITISILFSIMAISLYALSPMERYGRTQESLPLLTTEQLKNPVTQNLETKMHWTPANTNMLNLVNGVNATTGSYIYGFMYSPYPQKWKEIRTDNAQEVFLWNANGFYLTNCFERKGYLEGFSFEVIPGGYMFYHRTYTLDGEAVSEITHTSVSKTESWKAPVRLAYDPFEDICYGFAENPNTAVKSYYFIKMNPETFEVSIVKSDVAFEDYCTAFTFCNRDKNFYGVTSAGKLVRFDRNTGEETVLVETERTTNQLLGGLVYSPKDKAFFWQYCLPDENYSELLRIDDINKTVISVNEMPTIELSRPQYSTLLTGDDYEYDNAPKAIVVNEVNFQSGSLDGSISITMPTLTNAGADLPAKVRLQALVDGSTHTDIELQPGSNYTVNYSNLTAGLHRFRFYAYNGSEQSVRTEIKEFVGYETPLPPENVVLTNNKAMWDAVTTGTSGLDLSKAEITYKVYLNHNLIGETSDLSMDITLPTTGYQANVVEVAASNHGKDSELKASNRIITGDYLSIPVLIKPTDDDQYIVNIIDANSDGLTWHYDASRNGWTSDWSSLNSADDWLILPPINFDDPNVIYEMGMDVLTAGNRTESFEMWIGPSPVPATMTRVLANSVNSFEHNQQAVTFSELVAVSGVQYIGIHAVSEVDMYYMTVNNIFVNKTTSNTENPEAPTNVVVESAHDGDLACNVSFNMPTKNLKGESFDSSQEIEVRLSNITYPNNDVKSVKGKPGEHIETTYELTEGMNEIAITSYLNGNNGLSNKQKIWAGWDIPTEVEDFEGSITDDPLKVHLTWNAPTDIGQHGGWVNTSSIKYYICKYNSSTGKWSKDKEMPADGYTYELPENTTLANNEFGMVVGSSAGINTNVTTTKVTSGTPYTLPMSDDFNGGAVNCRPINIYRPESNYTATVGLADPSTLSANYATDSGKALVAIWSGEYMTEGIQIHFPYFSTEGIQNSRVVFTVLNVNGLLGPTNVYASTYEHQDVLLGTISNKSEDNGGWARYAFNLPEEFANKKWVGIYIDSKLTESKPYFILDKYRVESGLENDLGISDINCNSSFIIDKNYTISATVTNYGISAVAMPAAEAQIIKNGNVVTTIQNGTTGQMIQLDGSLSAVFDFKPTAEMYGDITVKININYEDQNSANNEVVQNATVEVGSSLQITDLEANRVVGDESTVQLKWSEVKPFDGVETFENETSFNYGEEIAGFQNLDMDKCYTYGWENWDFPGEEDLHAFIVFDDSYDQIPASSLVNMSAYSGHKYLLALSPLYYFAANDWLISPMIEGGSDISFYLNILSTEYGDELLGVYYSTTNSDISDFQLLETVVKGTLGWQQYKFTLPADARYFALRYYSTDAFGILLDDLSYIPKGGIPTLVGFDVERNGEIIAEAYPATNSYTDLNTEDKYLEYVVIPVTSDNSNQLTRNARSNKASVQPTSVAGIYVTEVKVISKDNGIYITGADGMQISVLTPSGIVLHSLKAQSDSEYFQLDKGVYMVKVNSAIYKVFVK